MSPRQQEISTLTRELSELLQSIAREVDADVQAFRRLQRRDPTLKQHPGVDQTLRARLEQQQVAEARLELELLHRDRYASEIQRLRQRLSRAKALERDEAPIVQEDHRSLLHCLHPSVIRILSRLSPPAELAERLPSVLRALAPTLNASMQEALKPGLQLVELFAGIGGLGLGLERALGATTVLQVEAVAERRAVLHRHFPLALQLEDVRQLLELPPPCAPERLVLCGGFPCRGASRANLTGPRGMVHAQTGLWSVLATLLRGWKPLLLVFENVTSLVSRGLDQVIADAHAAGYELWWGTLKASQVGAPHERSRLFGIALRIGAAHFLTPTRPPLPSWTRFWGEPTPVPANEPDAPAQRARVMALGDAVVPLVSYNIGLLARDMLNGMRPAPGRHVSRHSDAKGLPTFGYLDPLGQVYRLETPAAFEPTVRSSTRRFVTVDQHFYAPDAERITPPTVGWIVHDDGQDALISALEQSQSDGGQPDEFDPLDQEDSLDIKMPGGAVDSYPRGWTRALWPTLTASDGENLGGMGQYCRTSPGLNALAQGCCQAEPGLEVYGEALLESFAGQGLGPALAEWVMGFSPGWTLPMADQSAQPRTFTTYATVCTRLSGASP